MTHAQAVWDAYQALHRYARWPAPTPYIRVTGACPVRVATRPTTPAVHAAVDRLIAHIDMAVSRWPLPVDRATYTYFYLFTQWLRVSFPFKPRFLGPPVGWVHLVWRPLPVLAGAAHAAGPSHAWQGVYIREWLQRRQEQDAATVLDALRQLYRYIPPAEVRTQTRIQQQYALLTALSTRYACPQGQILCRFDATGQRRGGRTETPWHPHLLLAFLEAWMPTPDGGPSLVQQEAAADARALLAGPPQRLLEWLTHVVALCHPTALPIDALYDHFHQVCTTARDYAVWEARAAVFAAARHRGKEQVG